MTTLLSSKAENVRIPVRPARVAVALVIAVAGGYGLLCEHGYVSSSEAVVSAYVLDVRTPRDGIVANLPKAVGTTVQAGEVLGSIENLQLDRQELESLRSDEGVAAATADATGAERSAFETEQHALLSRAEDHRVAVVQRLKMEQAEENRTLAAAQLALAQANLELDRGRKLHDAGILATAEYDKVVSTQLIATEQVAAEQAKVGSYQAQMAAAQQGIFTEPGNGTDVGYSRQRADEMAVRIAESTRAIATSRAQAHLAHAALVTASARFSELERSDILSPINGVLWKFKTVNGERAATGEAVVSLIDCSRQFLLASIPQDRVPEIALHQQATFRLAGETAERTGTVLSVIEDLDGAGAQKLASLPAHRSGEQVATVVVALEPTGSLSSADGCIVGRTARVLLPTVPTNAASRFLHNYF